MKSLSIPVTVRHEPTGATRTVTAFIEPDEEGLHITFEEGFVLHPLEAVDIPIEDVRRAWAGE